MNHIIKTYLILGLLLSSFYSCQKPPEFSNTPIISNLKVFKQYQENNNPGDTINFSFDFTDGDGDLGLNSEDTVSPYWENKAPTANFNNILLTMFKKTKIGWVEVSFVNNLDLNGQFRRLQSEDKKSPIKGTLSYGFVIQNLAVSNLGIKKNDSIKFEIFIKDRALNNSNILKTEPLILTLK